MPFAVGSAVGLIAEEVVRGAVAGYPREAGGEIVGGGDGDATRGLREMLASPHRQLHLLCAQGGHIARVRVAPARRGVEGGPRQTGRAGEVERGVAALR